jgi:isoquinoline 1-oxidoreductase
MSGDPFGKGSWERERYELEAPPAYHFELDRRGFFKFLGAGILVATVLPPAAAFQESGGARRPMGESLPREIGAWLHFGENGVLTAYTGKVEVGQNIRTSLSQAVAEELRVPVHTIQFVMGDTQLTPFDMGTFGSRTTPTMNLQLRKVAAATRDLLVELAAKKWNVPVGELSAGEGKVTHAKSWRSMAYAKLVQGLELTQTIPAEDPLTPPAQWRVAGQPAAKVDGREFVTGKHRYPSDQRLPEMLFGKVLRPSSFNPTLVSLDTSEAEKMPGVTVVHDGTFIGAAAADEETAARGVAAIRAEWKAEPQPSSKELFDYLKKNTVEESGRDGGSRFEQGSPDTALAEAHHRLEQRYTVAYIAHTPL